MHEDTRPYVIAIVGSRRKKNTWSLAESLRPFVEEAGLNLLVESIYDSDVRDCIGCHRCVEGGECGMRDGMPALMARIQGAAGIVLASPVSMCGPSGRLKSGIDRTAAWFHRPVLAGKPGMALVTTAGSYQKDTLRYLATVSMHWGLLYCGGAVRNAGDSGKPLSPREAEKFIRCLRGGSADFRPSFHQLSLFQVQKVLAQKILPVDRTYWEDNGWTKKVFYVACRTPLWKRILAWTFYRILYAKVRGFDSDEDGILA